MKAHAGITLLKPSPVYANIFVVKDPDLGMFSEEKYNNDIDSRHIQGEAVLRLLAADGMSSNKDVKTQRYVINRDAGDGLQLNISIRPNQPICIYSSTIVFGTEDLESHCLTIENHHIRCATEHKIWDANNTYEWKSVDDYHHIFVVGQGIGATVYRNTDALKEEMRHLFKHGSLYILSKSQSMDPALSYPGSFANHKLFRKNKDGKKSNSHVCPLIACDNCGRHFLLGAMLMSRRALSICDYLFT
jgi:hypothetical protein